MSVVELTRFRTGPGQADALLAARPAMIEAFRVDRAGFLRADLVRLGEDEWLDVVVWESSGDYAESRAKGANSPAVQAFFAPITELISAEEGQLAG